MPNYGLLIDYEWCSGCHSCEVACKEEHGFPVGKHGIRVMEDGPWAINNHAVNFNHIPVPTDLCDLCADRVAAGKKPTCVHHCLCECMEFGPIEELAKKLTLKGKQYLWVPREGDPIDWTEEIDRTRVVDRVKNAKKDIEYSVADASKLGETDINKSFRMALQREQTKLDATSDMEALERKLNN